MRKLFVITLAITLGSLFVSPATTNAQAGWSLFYRTDFNDLGGWVVWTRGGAVDIRDFHGEPGNRAAHLYTPWSTNE